MHMSSSQPKLRSFFASTKDFFLRKKLHTHPDVIADEAHRTSPLHFGTQSSPVPCPPDLPCHRHAGSAPIDCCETGDALSISAPKSSEETRSNTSLVRWSHHQLLRAHPNFVITRLQHAISCCYPITYFETVMPWKLFVWLLRGDWNRLLGSSLQKVESVVPSCTWKLSVKSSWKQIEISRKLRQA